jgi:hypothetical protein
VLAAALRKLYTRTVRDIDLTNVLDGQKSKLAGLSKSLLDGNDEEFAQGVVELLANLAVQAASTVPALGELAKRGVAEAFALSSNAKLKREFAAIEREEDRQRFAEELAAPIEKLIGQALIQLVRTQHRVSDDVLVELGELREEFESFRADFGRRVSQASAVVGKILVSDDGTGIRVGSRTTKLVEVETLHVSGKGTGIELD